MTDTSMICLYFGNPEECQNCGGSVQAARGPFPGDSRYCSEDCFADAQEHAAQAARRAAEYQAAWCPECGYDRSEHDPSCTATATKRKEEG